MSTRGCVCVCVCVCVLQCALPTLSQITRTTMTQTTIAMATIIPTIALCVPDEPDEPDEFSASVLGASPGTLLSLARVAAAAIFCVGLPCRPARPPPAAER